MKSDSIVRITKWLPFIAFILAIIFMVIFIYKVEAQKSILPYNYTEWRQPIRQSNTIPLFKYDTTVNGVRITKVAELTNGSWVIFDSAQAEIIINNEYLKTTLWISQN